MDSMLITFVITVALIAVTVVPYIRRVRAKEARARKKFQNLKISGLHEAMTMHPHIDALQCIGCGACVRACPEGDVLGIIDGKAALIHGAKCVGHGLCAEACPVGAIELLMASPGRSASLPILDEHHETSVPNLFIVGELGGLGLIKNAVTQGTAVVRHIASLPRSTQDDVYDVAIIGAGPSGMAAGLTALSLDMRYIVLEQNDIGGTILQYPRAKVVMTAPVELPLWGQVKLREVKKEALLTLWQDIIAKTHLKIHTNEKVTEIRSGVDSFEISTTTMAVRAKYVVLALGRRGTPRKLGVPGEQLPKVAYRLIDTASYRDVAVLVVGGGDSAVEAAIGLAAQPGNDVRLSYRKGEFSRIKERNRKHLEEQTARKKITVIFNSDVQEIAERSVTLKTPDGVSEIPNDFVFIFAGGELPNEFLNKAGVQMHAQELDTKAIEN